MRPRVFSSRFFCFLFGSFFDLVWREEEREEAIFSLSLALLALLSLCSSLPPGFKKKNRKVYLRFTRRLRRMRVAIKSEKRTRANNRALMHRHVGKVRRKEPKETLGEGVFRRFFLFFSFERGEERPWWGEKKNRKFFWKERKRKN